MSSPGSIEPCMSTAGNWWTRPKRSSAVRKALPSGGNREIDRRVPTRRSAGATPVFNARSVLQATFTLLWIAG